jgi:uncharacterized protein YbjT (DUF2867 family)
MIVVVGATGTVGREVVRLLTQQGEQVGAVTRDPGAARFPDGVRVYGGDPSQPETLEAQLGDIDAILISPRAAGAGIGGLLELAKARGARRAVLLSAVTVTHPAGEARFADGYRNAERAMQASGLEWTVLRCTDFDANALAWAPQIQHGGVVRGAYGSAKTSPIHERDIGAVAAQALTDDVLRHAGQAYLLTGPESIDQYDKVRLLGEAIDETLSFQEITPQQLRQAMLAQGLPEEIPDRLLGSGADYAKTPQPTTNTVAEILGRPALGFGQWARDHADAFRVARVA